LRSLAIASGSDRFFLVASVSHGKGGQWPSRRWQWPSRRWHLASSYKLLLKAMALLAMALVSGIIQCLWYHIMPLVSYNARYCELFFSLSNGYGEQWPSRR
jgi:hypothetical protein